MLAEVRQTDDVTTLAKLGKQGQQELKALLTLMNNTAFREVREAYSSYALEVP